MSERNITFEIKEHLGVIAEFDNGWNKELNIISWNGNTPKYDIRDWDSHHERMRKGVTLHEAEFRRLVDLYLHNNSRKAVELGRGLEAERKQRRREQAEAWGKNGEPADVDCLTADCGKQCGGLYSENCGGEEFSKKDEENIQEFCKAESEGEAETESEEAKALKAGNDVMEKAAEAGFEKDTDEEPQVFAPAAVPF